MLDPIEDMGIKEKSLLETIKVWKLWLFFVILTSKSQFVCLFRQLCDFSLVCYYGFLERRNRMMKMAPFSSNCSSKLTLIAAGICWFDENVLADLCIKVWSIRASQGHCPLLYDALIHIRLLSFILAN